MFLLLLYWSLKDTFLETMLYDCVISQGQYLANTIASVQIILSIGIGGDMPYTDDL